MTNLPKITDLAKMVLIFEKEYSVTDDKTYTINADMSFEELAKKKKTLKMLKVWRNWNCHPKK